MSGENLIQELNRISSLALSNEALRERLLNDPNEVIREKGLELPADMEVKAVLNGNAVELVVLPIKLDEDELLIGDLEQVAGGFLCQNPFGCGNTTGL